MMKFIKTVRTNNGNYAVFFQQVPDNFVHIAGVYLNRDGHLIRPMSGLEPVETWNKWGKAAKAVVPKFHIPFLTIGRELERFYRDFLGTEDNFSTVSEAQKWVEETKYELVSTEKYDSVSFMGKTITSYAVWYLDPEDEWPNHCQSGKVVTGSWYFNVIS